VTRAPDLVEPVIAFRSWRAVGGVLLSPYIDRRWDGDVAEAHCHRGEPGRFRHAEALLDEEHVSPHPRCLCGIHAYLDPRSAVADIDFRRVLGIVAVWGNIELHPRGLRAQFAQIRALATSPAWSGWHHGDVVAIAARLGVPLVPEERLAAVAPEFGSPVPAQLRGSSAA
jgi:hypothetical protein